MSDEPTASPALQPEEIKQPPAPKPEPEWQYDEDKLRVELQPKKELEWRRLAADLTEKAYLAKDTDLDEFVNECRQLTENESIGLRLLFVAEQINAPFGAMLTASAVLVREALDQEVPFNLLSELDEFYYPSSPTKTNSEWESDVGELAAWVSSVMAQRPQRIRTQDVDHSTFTALKGRLSELAIVCYCKVRGWSPVYKKIEKRKKIDPADLAGLFFI